MERSGIEWRTGEEEGRKGEGREKTGTESE